MLFPAALRLAGLRFECSPAEQRDAGTSPS